MTTATPAPARDRYAVPLLVAVLGGCLVALILGLYARLHHPTGFSLDIVGFSSAPYAKGWLTTFAAAFAVVKVVTGRRARQAGAANWIPAVHRSSGPDRDPAHGPGGGGALHLRAGIPDLLDARAYPLDTRMLLLRRVRGQDAEPDLARLNAPMGSPGTRRYGLPRVDRRVADLVPMALHEQGVALLTMRVRLPIAKGEAPCSR
jgi:hypothetical protein